MELAGAHVIHTNWNHLDKGFTEAILVLDDKHSHPKEMSVSSNAPKVMDERMKKVRKQLQPKPDGGFNFSPTKFHRVFQNRKLVDLHISCGRQRWSIDSETAKLLSEASECTDKEKSWLRSIPLFEVDKKTEVRKEDAKPIRRHLGLGKRRIVWDSAHISPAPIVPVANEPKARKGLTIDPTEAVKLGSIGALALLSSGLLAFGLYKIPLPNLPRIPLPAFRIPFRRK